MVAGADTEATGEETRGETHSLFERSPEDSPQTVTSKVSIGASKSLYQHVREPLCFPRKVVERLMAAGADTEATGEVSEREKERVIKRESKRARERESESDVSIFIYMEREKEQQRERERERERAKGHATVFERLVAAGAYTEATGEVRERDKEREIEREIEKARERESERAIYIYIYIHIYS